MRGRPSGIRWRCFAAALVVAIAALAEGRWEQVAVSGETPSGRSDHSAVLTEDDTMLVFGGNCGAYTLDLNNHLYSFHIPNVTWTRLSPNGGPPAIRYRHSGVYDAARRSMYIFGGATVTQVVLPPVFLNDLWKYSLEKNEWTEVKATGDTPSGRDWHSALIINDAMYVFAGIHGTARLNDLYQYDIARESWKLLNPTGETPVARNHFTAVASPDGDMYVFGGTWKIGYDGYLNEVLKYDVDKNHWQTLEVPGRRPTKRNGHTAVVVHNSMLVFGGYELAGIFENDLHTFDFHTEEWSAIYSSPLPTPRYSHTAVLASDGCMYVFGGYSDLLNMPSTQWNDTWKFIPDD